MARSISLLLIEAGGEHLPAFVKTLSEPMEPIARWPCIRSMHGPCAPASWLLDPAIDADSRITRTFAETVDGMDAGLEVCMSHERTQAVPGQD